MLLSSIVVANVLSFPYEPQYNSHRDEDVVDFHVSFSYLMKDQYEEEKKKQQQQKNAMCWGTVWVKTYGHDITEFRRRDAMRRDDLGVKVLKRYVGIRKWLKTDV